MHKFWLIVIAVIAAGSGLVFFLIETRGLRTQYDAAVAVWHLKEGAFTYGKFVLKSIEYNVR
jgi:hypothetical protein